MVATVIPATRAQPFVKKGCPSQCGSVTIPYPFSTKEGCFLNHNFYIHCDESIACLAHMKLIITDCDRRSVAGLNHGCSRLLPSSTAPFLNPGNNDTVVIFIDLQYLEHPKQAHGHRMQHLRILEGIYREQKL
ncbi:hypothetical protein PVK06_006228 [Gossypium arboreum]|uniref:Wall-associated receptor kinase galacturonan-binding domain-containing protein n=1 Tax=Gossypium arboreum TaxID=29729 RepID=A0ABR0QWX4_GOSAR|nr:hypothetical protein PVK06_006228 [Gossypium arboreum]